MTDAPIDMPQKIDDKYFDFMMINTYNQSTKLDEMNEAETLALPSKSIEITFTISGLSKALADIESGAYVNPETGLPISGEAPADPTPTPGNPTPTPGNPTPEPPVSSLKKGASFTSGNYKYKVTKAAVSNKGTVTLTGLSTKGKSAKKLSVATTVKGTDGVSYTINAIGSKAFSGAKATSITLNKNIKAIPSSAFAKCKKLSSITLKAKLSKASKNAFNGCKKKIAVKGTSKKANLKLLKKTSYKKFK